MSCMGGNVNRLKVLLAAGADKNEKDEASDNDAGTVWNEVVRPSCLSYLTGIVFPHSTHYLMHRMDEQPSYGSVTLDILRSSRRWWLPVQMSMPRTMWLLSGGGVGGPCSG